MTACPRFEIARRNSDSDALNGFQTKLWSENPGQSSNGGVVDINGSILGQLGADSIATETTERFAGISLAKIEERLHQAERAHPTQQDAAARSQPPRKTCCHGSEIVHAIQGSKVGK